MLSTQQQQNNQPTSANNNPAGSTTSKKATGIVTKILENFGFIDDSIFFPLSVVKGNTPVKVGDKVYFECTYSKNLPFNWNATIVQPISSNSLNNQQPTVLHHPTSSVMHHQHQQQRQPQQPPSQIHNLSHAQPPHLAPPSQGLSLQQQQQQHPYQQPLQSVAASTVAAPQSAPLNPSQQPLLNPNMYHHPSTPQGAGQNSGPAGYHPGYPPIQNKQVPQYGGHQPASSNQTQPMFNPSSYPQQHGGNVVGSSNQPPPQQQPSVPPPQSVTQPQTATAPQTHVDMVKIQQAVAAAAQLSQFYSPTVAGQQPGRPDSSVLNHQQQQLAGGGGGGGGGSQLTAGSGHHQYGGPSGGGGTGVGQIQYTSTPGSAFIGSQYNSAASVPVTAVSGGGAQIAKKPVPPGSGLGSAVPSNRVPGGRWDHPRDDPSQHHRFDQGGQSKIRPVGGVQPRDDPRTGGSRFSGKSRFNDSDSRFSPVTPMKNEDRFSQNQPVYHSPAQDHFRGNTVGTRMVGGDLRKDQESRFNRDRSRDRDNINANKTMERDQDRSMGRDRRERDRPNRMATGKKRSLSPSPSVASSTGTASFTASSKSLGLNYLPKRHYEPCNIPKSTLVKNRYNSLELKSKIDCSVHIPSDLKEVFYNVDFNLDLLDVPKPLSYKIINEKYVKKDEKDLKSSGKKRSTSVEKSEKTEEKQPEEKIKSKPEEKKQQAPPSEEPAKNKDDEKKAEQPEVKVESQQVVMEEDKIQNDEPANKTEEISDSKDEAKPEMNQQEDTLMIQEEEEKKEKEEEEKIEKKDEEIEKKVEETSNNIDPKDSKPEEKPKNVEESQTAMEVEPDKPETETSPPSPTVTTAIESEKEKASQPSESSHSRGKNSHHGSKETTNKPANHKFNVKVLIISLPSMAEIYERLFGAEFANVASYSPNSSSTNQNPISNRERVSHFHKLFSMLVSRNSNGGYSFIGGKYIKELDGYLPGSNEPNLVRTSIRIVWEQTGLNLSTCRQWSVISTFVYNRDNCLNPSESGYEITKIYFPDLWSALDSIYQQPPWLVVACSERTPTKQSESQPPSAKHLEETKMETVDDEEPEMKPTKPNEELKTSGETEANDSGNQVQSSTSMDREDLVFIKDVPNVEKKKYLQKVLETINNYKVYELKNELEKLGVKFESRCKKEQLYQQLQKVVKDSLKILDGIEPVDITIGNDEQIMMSQEDSMTVEGDESQMEKPADNIGNGNGNGNSLVATKRKLEPEKSPDPNESEKIEEKNDDKESSNKKPKLNEEKVVDSKNDEKLTGPALASNIKVKGNQSSLTLVSLHTALDPHRFDQFELSVVSEFIRDSLTMHFVQYIYSSLVHQVKLQKPIVPSSSSSSSSTTETRNNTMANYCHLAFTYFDKGHCGYMPSDDLNILLNMAGFPISKKCFNSLVSSLMSLANITVSASSSTILNERIVYIFFEEPSTLIPRQVIYPTMAGQLQSSQGFRTMSDGGDQEQLVVERNGIQYNFEELIKQSVADQKLKVRLNDSLADCTKKIAQLENQITELDNKQRKMSAATARQNDELCAVKRERDQIKTKYEQIKIYWRKATMGFNTLMKKWERSAKGASKQNEPDPAEPSESKKSTDEETETATNPVAMVEQPISG